jgi:hypothetical protein
VVAARFGSRVITALFAALIIQPTGRVASVGYSVGYRVGGHDLRSYQMEFLSKSEIDTWCQSREIVLSNRGFLRYEKGGTKGFTIVLNEKPADVINLGIRLIPDLDELSMLPGPSATPFSGALMWVRERGIWGKTEENTGEMMISQLRLARGETAPLSKRPGHLFGHNEFYETQSFFMIPLLFGWDAFVVPENGDYFVFVSHDDVIAVVSRTTDINDHFMKRLEDWNPRDDGWYSNVL